MHRMAALTFWPLSSQARSRRRRWPEKARLYDGQGQNDIGKARCMFPSFGRFQVASSPGSESIRVTRSVSGPDQPSRGRSFLSAPRTDPCSQDSRTRLLPRVVDGETIPWPWMKDSWPREPFCGDFPHPLQCDPARWLRRESARLQSLVTRSRNV
jgi:hypothetical protein